MQYVLSVPAPESIASLVRREYAKEILECRLLRSYVNDVYCMETANERFIGKLYREGWRTRENILYELDFLRHVRLSGLPVAACIPAPDGRMIITVDAPEGERFFVLYEYAEGAKPNRPFTDALYRETGRTLGRLHRASAAFTSHFARDPYDADFMLVRPLSLAEPYFEGRKDDFAYLKSLADHIGKTIRKLDPGMTKGVCHGDYTLDNLHVTHDGHAVLYDFDACGPGYLAQDLLGAYQVGKLPGGDIKWAAHLAGYLEEMPLSAEDLAALPYLRLMENIWFIGCSATLWARVSGTWRITGESLDGLLSDIRTWAAEEHIG